MKPGGVFFITVLLWFFLGAAAFFSQTFFKIWFLAGTALFPLAAADFLLLFRFTGRFTPEREIRSSLGLGKGTEVILSITKTGKGLLPVRTAIFDLYPPSVTCRAFPAVLDRRVLKRGTLIFTYEIVPIERGSWEFPGLEMLLSSPLRLWQRKSFYPLVSRGRIYPDFKKMAGRALEGTLERTGLNAIRKRGPGLEFQSLREYQQGDPVRAIDWRATARRQKFIIREYQEEQDQQVLFLLDSGYRLHRREEFRAAGPDRHGASPERTFLRTQFDDALEAAMLLSYVALKHGDAVAAGVFGAEDRWLPPRKGLSALTGLLNSIYDLKSAPVPSSPFSVLETALNRLNRRSFIILISNFREEDGESLSWILPRIEKRHLLLVVSLRESEVEELAQFRSGGNAASGNFAAGRDAAEMELEAAAARTYLASRRQLYKTWEHLGLLTLESAPADLSSSLINSYLQVKRSGRL
ncbi:MAG: DUF58 domain-containing protein [Treponema sp.]|nr:DUF58 domain-containing protein [Treponema sp.]